MQRQPRNLSFLKCTRCRKDRQKCTPLDRSWPGRRCDRCIKFDYSCSANQTARVQSQRFFEALEPLSPHENVPERMGFSVSATSPHIHPNLPLTAESTPPKGPNTIVFPDNTSDGDQSSPKCAELFGALKQAGWSYPRQLKFSEREPENSPGRSIAWGLGAMMKSWTCRFYLILKDRENHIKIHQKYQDGVKGNLALGFHLKKAERLTIAHLILTISRLSEDEEDISAADFALSIVHCVREGGRWQELIGAVAAPEILLIGLDPGEKSYKEDGDGHGEDIPSAVSLEKHFHKDYKSMDIAKIIRSGDNNVFAKMKDLLLVPDLQLKETCQRLSGLLQLIDHLGEVDESFGIDNDLISPTNEEPAMPKEAKNFQLVSFLSSKIEQQIKEVLWNPDPGFESDFGKMCSKIESCLLLEIERQMKEPESEMKGKETSSNDGGTEDIYESDAGDKNKAFDENFCMHFLNNNAFS